MAARVPRLPCSKTTSVPSPYQQLIDLHLRAPEALPFASYLDYHLRNGYVVAHPDFMFMMIPVNSEELRSGRNPYEMSVAPVDCWYLSSMAGEMGLAWQYEPFPLPYYAFHRDHGTRKSLSIWPRHRLKQRTA